jgi:hypothetical protein
LDVLADAVTSRVNTLDRERLQSLESVTSSFETKGRSVVSSSTQITGLGFISTSVDITPLNSFTSSQQILNTAFQNGISSRLTTSSFDSFSSSVHSEIIAATNEQNLSNLSTTGSNTFIGNQNITGSLIVSGSNIQFSGSNIEFTREWPAVGSESHFLRLVPFTSSTGRYYDGLGIGVEHWDDGTGTYEHSIQIHSWDNHTSPNYGAELNVGPYRTHMRVYPSSSSGNLSNVSVQELSNGKTQALVYGDYVHIGAYSGQEILIGNNSASIVVSGSNMLFDTPLTSSNSITATSFNGIINATNGVISGSSQLTSSFDTRYTLSGSVQPLPSNLVSSSAQITAFGFVSSSTTINTGSFATTGSNSFNGNQTITGSLFVTGLTSISTSFSLPTGSSLLILSGSTIYVDSSGSITGSLSGSIFGIGDVVAFSSSVNSRINNIISAPAGTISGSSQLTSSFDTRYTLSGSISSVPSGTISGSSQLTSSYDSRYSLSGSILTSFSSSVDNRLDTLETSIISGSINYTQVLGNKRTGITSTGTSIISGSITTTGNPVQIMVTGDANPIGGAGWCRLQIFRDGNGIGNIIQVENSSNLNVPYCLNVIDTPSAGTYTYSMRTVDSMSGTFDFGEFSGPLLTVVELKSNTQLPSGLISGSSQLTSSYDTRYTLSGSVQPLPSGLISGSSQLTASYDTRYTLSGSVVSGTTPAGTISGSSQLTSSFDSRYVLETETGSLQTSITSLNTLTSSLATTGSNSFNGNQTITGSLNVSSIAVVSSSFTANSSSLTLNSGSNLYVQNNGIVEITGSLKVSGSTNLIVNNLQIGTGSGDEGGEIQLAKAVTNTTLTGSAVTVDVYRDRVRIFEQGGDARGVHIDLSKAPGGVAGELMWKSSGIVNAGTFVTLDNIKATLTSSSNRGLSVAAVSTNFSANISAYHAYSGGIAGISANNQSITTTPTTSLFGWNFPAEADGSYYNILDKTNNRFYRITLMIGATFDNNFISIERLY